MATTRDADATRVGAPRTGAADGPAPRLPVRRVPVSAEGPAPDRSSRSGYADAFELALPAPHGGSAETWLRTALDGAPFPARAVIRVLQSRVLRLRLAPAGTAGTILGWHVASVSQDQVRIVTTSPVLGDAVILGMRPSPTMVRAQTALTYRRPVMARGLWLVLGPLHRAFVPWLLRRAAKVLVAPRS